MRVRTAVIPAAGKGTRFLPLTKAVPKELLPIGSVPALQLILDEAAGAGIEHVVIVSSRAKPAIEEYVADLPEPAGLRISITYQDDPRGLGHAVGCARELVGDEPFAVLLPDEIMGGPSLLDEMCRVCERTGGSVVGVKQVPIDEVSSYGVVDPVGAVDEAGVVAVRDVREKPPADEAPSDLIIIGRYVLTPDIFDHIAALRPGAGGELQLTDALRAQAAVGPFHAVVSRVRRFDTGTPYGWLTAVVELSLDDADHGDAFRSWLSGLDTRR